jgi:glutaminase
VAGPAESARISARLNELYERHRTQDEARLASYYASGRGYYPPAEAGEERDRFAICLATVGGELYTAGDHDVPFALQSISKVFAYALALADHRLEDVLARVGVEPSGDAFNSIVFDERHHRPYNPMVNAGALVTTDLVRGDSSERKLERLLGLMQVCAGDSALHVDERTVGREIRSADRNRATAYLMRAERMLDGNVEDLLSLYLHQCSVQVSCAQLAVMAATLANGCVNPITGERALPRSLARDVLSVMYTCGMYDAAGQWAYEVGVPAKSGVSGGILAVVPGKLGIGVWSPGLDVYGNSVRGVDVCYEIADRLGLHVFAGEDEDAVLGSGTPSEARPSVTSETPSIAPRQDRRPRAGRHRT